MVHNLPSPPATPAFPSEPDYPSHPGRPSLAQLEQRIASLEESNAKLLQAFARYTVDNVTSTTLPPLTPTSPTSSSTFLTSAHAQKATDQRCFLLSQRVQALQSQLTQCVDACSSALETERDMRSDLERDNERLSDEIRVLREERDSLGRQLKRFDRMATARNLGSYGSDVEELRPRAERPYDPHHIPPLKEEADRPPKPPLDADTLDDAVVTSAARLARLRLSTLSDASTVVDDEITVSKRPSTRNSWYIMADKARSMLSVRVDSQRTPSNACFAERTAVI
ncbi:hypothetical protein BDV98DRAFT_558107 [Pterulicium gracile]|uniref:Uncharacterized protein n=1 Tax=Pterulicium gracile TaxID=1884261 RepID=A0A5C3QZX6_9AGAR|nr:hypothetical protein BDV98DRAFT_558107 [Pterula gracilis]